MKTTTHFKYIEWRDPQGLHEDTVESISDLKFLKDELQFLEGLANTNMLEPFYGKSFEESSTIFNQLKAHTIQLEIQLKELAVHANNLQTLLDDDDVLGEVKVYKDEHYRLMIAEMNFHSAVKKTKRAIFKMLSEAMKGKHLK